MVADNETQPVERRPTAGELVSAGWHDYTLVGDFYCRYISPNGKREVLTRTTVHDRSRCFDRLKG